MEPMEFGVVPAVNVVNGMEADAYRKSKAEYHKEKSKWDRMKLDQREGKVPPSPPEPSRKKNIIYTAPTTQGIRADMAEFEPSSLACWPMSCRAGSKRWPARAHDRH